MSGSQRGKSCATVRQNGINLQSRLSKNTQHKTQSKDGEKVINTTSEEQCKCYIFCRKHQRVSVNRSFRLFSTTLAFKKSQGQNLPIKKCQNTSFTSLSWSNFKSLKKTSFCLSVYSVLVWCWSPLTIQDNKRKQHFPSLQRSGSS